jgi:hypothetical protein
VALLWEKDGEAFHAASVGPDGAARFHLFVELNGPWWEWAVLRPGEEWAAAVLRGRTVTRHGAMWDAERVALLG